MKSENPFDPLQRKRPLMSHTFAAIDIGTNSIRLAVVRNEGQNATTLDIQRQVVRLGEGEFEDNKLTEEAINRGVLVCTRSKGPAARAMPGICCSRRSQTEGRTGNA